LIFNHQLHPKLYQDLGEPLHSNGRRAESLLRPGALGALAYSAVFPPGFRDSRSQTWLVSAPSNLQPSPRPTYRHLRKASIRRERSRLWGRGGQQAPDDTHKYASPTVACTNGRSLETLEILGTRDCTAAESLTPLVN
jgi:hypothetical protein